MLKRIFKWIADGQPMTYEEMEAERERLYGPDEEVRREEDEWRPMFVGIGADDDLFFLEKDWEERRLSPDDLDPISICYGLDKI